MDVSSRVAVEDVVVVVSCVVSAVLKSNSENARLLSRKAGCVSEVGLGGRSAEARSRATFFVTTSISLLFDN